MSTFFQLPTDVQLNTVYMLSSKQKYFLMKSIRFRGLARSVQRAIRLGAHVYARELMWRRATRGRNRPWERNRANMFGRYTHNLMDQIRGRTSPRYFVGRYTNRGEGWFARRNYMAGIRRPVARLRGRRN